MKEYNILYVDDEQANLNSLKSLFRRKFNIITATSGLQGLELLEEYSIQLIIADQRMPLMTGVDFLKKVKEKWPRIKFILLTGYHDNEVIKEAVNEVGIYWYMNKPFDNNQLELIITKAFEAYQAEKKLKESEEKFRGVFNSMTDVFVRRDFNGKVILVSPSVFDVTGYTEDEIIGKDVQFYHIDSLQVDLMNQKLFEKEGVQDFELEIIKKDGRTITISSNAKIYYDDTNNPLGVESVFRDITDKKRAEKAIKESEEKFKGVFNSLIDVFIRRDMEQKVVLVSPSIYEVTGYSVEDVLGQDMSKYFVESQKPKWIKQYLLENRGVQTIEFEMYKKDGSIITVSANAKIYYNDAGIPLGVESVFRNVTNKNIAEEALKESKERYQSLSDASFEAIFISEKGVCVEQNALAEKMFGYKLSEAIGRNATEWIEAGDRELVINNILSGYEKPYEITALRKDGSTFPAEIQGRMMNIKGKDVRVTALNDITERRKAEEELQKSEKRFSDVADNASEWIWEVDSNGKYTYVSPVVERILGYKPEEMLQRYFYDSFIPDDKEEMKRAAFETFANKERIHELINPNVHKNGKVVWLSTSGIPIIDKKGELVGYRGADTDITKDKKVEKDKEKLLHDVKERLKELNCLYTISNSIRTREKLEEIFQDIVDAIPIGWQYPEITRGKLHYNDREWVSEPFKDTAWKQSSDIIIDGQKLGVVEVYYLEECPIMDEGPFMKEERNLINSIAQTLTETIVHKKAEEKLLESEKKFKTLVTNTEEIIYMLDKDGTFLLSEGKGLEKLGLKGGDVVGQSVFELYKDFPEMLDKMNLAFSGETVIVEHAIGDNDFKSWYTPQVNQKDEIIGLLGLSINITEQKQAESKILKYQKRLKALNVELTITEEKQRKQIATDLHDHVGQFMASSRLQLLAINEGMEKKDILLTLQNISKDLSLGIKAIRTAIFDLSTPQLNEIGLFAAISDWAEEQIELKHGIKTHLSGDDQIYTLEENTRILLFRSIRELLINVVKHAKATRVNVEIREKSGTLEIIIEDNGVGFTSNPEIGSKKNHGLGLFSIEERLRDLKGSIIIDSSKKGTKVKLNLPLADKEQ